jgi:YesN/AraC family two-component response regulator
VLAVSQTILERSYSVLTAIDGQEALDLFHQYGNRIELFICDVVMPNLDGFELARRIIAEGVGVRLILMSGYSPSYISQSFPGIPFLAKPFTKEQLETAVAEALRPAPPKP